MKKLIVVTLSLIMMFSMSIAISAEEEMTIIPISSVTTEVTSLPVSTENTEYTVLYNGEAIVSDVPVQVIDGVTYLPLRATLEKMGFEITWNGETKTIEILKGAQWTSVTIGQNAYFKNKMAPHALSSAPVIVDNRTLIPVEFIADILGRHMSVENSQILITEDEATIQEGYVKSITVDDAGMTTVVLTSDFSSDSFELQTILHLSPATTIQQVELKVGDYVHSVSAMFMTMSLPAQTSGYIVY